MPTTGSGAPAATHTGPPDIAGYSFTPTPVRQDAHTQAFEGRELASRRRVLALAPRAPSDLAVVQRLRREAGLLRSLSHPNIVGLHPGPVPIGADALILEHVAGPSLADWLADPTHPPLDGRRLCGMAGDIAAALDFAQSQGVTHGDVQPANILLPSRGPARLIGFGSELPGDADARADVYGLAATVYYALSGTPPAYTFTPAREEGGTRWLYTLSSASPFRAPALTRPDGTPATAASLDSHLISPAARRPDLPPAAADVIRQGLAAHPQDRFVSAGAFAAALQDAWAGDRTFVAAVLPGRRGAVLRPLAALAGGAALLGAGLWLGMAARRTEAPAGSGRLAQFAPLKKKPARRAPSRLARIDTRSAVLPMETSDATEPGLLLLSGPDSETGPPDVRLRSRTKAARHALPAKRQALHRARRPVSAPFVNFSTTPPPEAFSPAPASPGDSAWLRVTARQAVNASAKRPFVANVHAERVSVDGSPSVTLSEGGWVRLAPGPHRIAFYPPTGGPFAPNPNLRVDLTPGSRRHIQVPLPRRVADDTVVGGISHFGDAPGIINAGTQGGPARGDDTDDNTPETRRRASAGHGGL